MNLLSAISLSSFALSWVLLLTCSPLSGASAPSGIQSTPTNAPVLIKSVFVNDPKTGKDPFFPSSKRREAEVAAGALAGLPVVATLPTNLVLRGFSGPPSRRLVVINHHTFAVGETAQIKVDGQLLKIQCVEIRDKSALIKCNDSPPKELLLRKGM